MLPLDIFIYGNSIFIDYSIPWPIVWDHWWVSRICKSSWRAQNEMTNFGSCLAIIFTTWSTKIPLIWANKLFINVLYLKSIPKFVKWQAKTKQWHKIYIYYLCINPHWFLIYIKIPYWMCLCVQFFHPLLGVLAKV